jgi:hypothetical protein
LPGVRVGVFFRAEARVTLREIARVRGDIVARRGKRIDAARNEGGQVRSPGRNQFRFAFSVLGAGLFGRV